MTLTPVDTRLLFILLHALWKKQHQIQHMALYLVDIIDAERVAESIKGTINYF